MHALIAWLWSLLGVEQEGGNSAWRQAELQRRLVNLEREAEVMQRAKTREEPRT